MSRIPDFPRAVRGKGRRPEIDARKPPRFNELYDIYFADWLALGLDMNHSVFYVVLETVIGVPTATAHTRRSILAK